MIPASMFQKYAKTDLPACPAIYDPGAGAARQGRAPGRTAQAVRNQGALQ